MGCDDVVAEHCLAAQEEHSLAGVTLPGIIPFSFPTMLLHTLWGLCVLNTARAVTVYGQIPLGQTSTASGPQATQKPLQAAYDETLLTPPALPNDRAPTAFTLNLQANNATVPQLSIPQHGSFYGFSIEMSVITQLSECFKGFLVLHPLTNESVVGKNSFVLSLFNDAPV